MNILCLQHVPFEGPAALADWAESRGHHLICHPVYQSDDFPSLDTIDALFVMGGPMNIYEEADYPWLKPEKDFIRTAIQADRFVLGVCLGAQLIADVLGAKVTRGPGPEIGWFPIRRAAGCPVGSILPAELPVLHWHGDQFDLPPSATRLAESERTPNQGFLYNGRVLALQCHLEATPQSVAVLADACADELVPTDPGIMSASRLLAEPDATYAQMHAVLFNLLDQMTGHFEAIDWGLTDYPTALQRQKARVEQRRQGLCGDALIFTEHHPIYTMGLRKGADAHLLWGAEECAAKGISVFASNRGGDITYHGPGQIVAYPILSLQQRKDLHAYLRDLEEVVIRTLHSYGLPSARREGKTGIWIDQERKICAIGVAVRSWITYHGFALNVSPDMGHFAGIIPCGITDGSVTSLVHELGYDVDLAEVKTRLAVEFKEVFVNTHRII